MQVLVQERHDRCHEGVYNPAQYDSGGREGLARQSGQDYENLFEGEEHINGVVPVLKVTRPDERHLSATTIE